MSLRFCTWALGFFATVFKRVTETSLLYTFDPPVLAIARHLVYMTVKNRALTAGKMLFI